MFVCLWLCVAVCVFAFVCHVFKFFCGILCVSVCVPVFVCLRLCVRASVFTDVFWGCVCGMPASVSV